MKLSDLIGSIEEFAPASLQEDYDNSGLIIGHPGAEIRRCLVCLDVTEPVMAEAIEKKCELIISHHPVIFKGINRLTGSTLTERLVARAVREGVAVYSAHTNLDNIADGVNRILAEKLGMIRPRILRPKSGTLCKLVTFCPSDHAVAVREAIFRAGAGQIGEYDQCSYNSEGTGTFRAGDQANPFVGDIGALHYEPELRIETVFPAHLRGRVLAALLAAHPYEEVAYDIYRLENENPFTGAGMIGELAEEVEAPVFLQKIKEVLKIPYIRHSALIGEKIKKVAICGGSGSFLLPDAIRQGADIFITADVKYNLFHEVDGKIVIVDAGHYETEQFTCDLLAGYLKKKFANFAVFISEVPVNPVNYF